MTAEDSGKEIEEFEVFTEIESLENIVEAYAGSTHSLFRTCDGKLLACGSNSCGELFLNSGPSADFFFSPVETMINRDAKLCIAGDTLSSAFIEYFPKNNPNIKISSSFFK